MNTLKIGDKVPNFSEKNQYNEIFQLSDYQNQKIIIFFYPKANTPGYTNEVCNLQNQYALLKEKGFVLIGISADSTEKQLKFSEKHHLSYPLLANENKSILKLFGVWGIKKFMGKEFEGIHRKTFILNENHIITHIIEKVNTKNHTQQIIEILEK